MQRRASHGSIPVGPCSIAALLLAVPALSGCVFPFECESEHVEVAFPATVERGSGETSTEAFGSLAPGNIGDDYDAVKAVLVGDSYRSPTWVVWTLSAFDSNGGYIAVNAGGPFRPGDVLPVSAAYAGGGWGLSSVPPSDGPEIGVRDGDFVSTSASGTLEVLEVEPLSFRVDVEVANDQEETLRLQGDMSFSLVVLAAACE